MAIYPGAIHRWLTVNKNRARLNPVRVNLHVAVSEASSLYGYFNNYSNPDSHFYVRKDGSVEQMVDTSLRAHADLHGNKDTISIETQGGVRNSAGEPWTAAQVQTLANIFRWARQVHGISGKLAKNSKPGSSSHGLSWHRLGVNGNFPGGLLKGRVRGGILYSRARGKTCPGDAKIRQIPGILNLALGISGGGTSKPGGGKSSRKGNPYTPAVDGDFGPVTKKALQWALRKAGYTGHAVDGDFGAYSIRSLQRMLRKRGQKGHAIDGDFGSYTVRSLQRWLRKRGQKGHAIDGRFGAYTVRSLQSVIRKNQIK